MNYWREVRKTMRYIEEHLKDDITLNELARNVGYSAYHFSRLFRSTTGLSTMDYVRRRRLVHALADMDNGKDMVGIALDYGFETQGGFIRAFHKVYGETPGNYRIQVLRSLPHNIQLISIGYQRKEHEKMQINKIEDELVLKKVMGIADKMFNITAQGDGKYGYAFWQKRFLETPELMVYAEDAGKICGLAFGWVDGNAVTIAYVGVEQEYQGQGIGRALVAEMENRAKALGYNQLGLGSAAGEEGFYEKCGYAGTLLIQSEEHSIDQLRSLNPGHEEIGSGVYEGYVNQLWLKIPAIDRGLQKMYEDTLPGCNTVMVFSKTV